MHAMPETYQSRERQTKKKCKQNIIRDVRNLPELAVIIDYVDGNRQWGHQDQELTPRAQMRWAKRTR
jgi:hypothetical protein